MRGSDLELWMQFQYHARPFRIADGSNGLCANSGGQDSAGMRHDGRFEGQHPFAGGKILLNAFGNASEFAGFVLFPMKGFDNADATNIFLHHVVPPVLDGTWD